MPGSTRRGGTASWCAASARREPSHAVSLVLAGPVGAAGDSGAVSVGSGAGTAPGGRIRRARTTVRPADLLAASMTRACSRRVLVAQAVEVC
jgi:hypothetical protein